ncbi:MAG: response regulator [Bacteriovoracaceae bacterium]
MTKKRLLIIEDEFLIQHSLKKLFEKKGLLVDVTNSGKKAINLIHTKDYDKIICDLMLKDITGFEVIEESKKKFTTEDIKTKFVIMTAYSSEQILEKASYYQCKIINKPFNIFNNQILDNFLD